MSAPVRVAVAAALVFASFSATGAEGFYFGAGWNKSSVGGDFDGEGLYGSSTEVIIVPKIDSGSGFAFFGGVHANEH